MLSGGPPPGTVFCCASESWLRVISSIEDHESGKAVYYYQVDLSLTDLETNEKVWLGQKKLKKVVASRHYKV